MVLTGLGTQSRCGEGVGMKIETSLAMLNALTDTNSHSPSTEMAK
jgi:hypothetical protein